MKRGRKRDEIVAKAYNECLPWQDYHSDTFKWPLTPEEFMVHIRGERECTHRQRLFRTSVRRPMEPYFPLIRPAPALEFWDAIDCFNKSVAVYNLVGGNRDLLLCLQNYLYRAWLKPYRNNIEFGHFVAKFIVPVPHFKDPHRSEDGDPCLQRGQSADEIANTIRLVADLHLHIANEAERVVMEQEKAEDEDHDEPVNEDHWDHPRKSHFKYFAIRPLFRALIMVIAEYDEKIHKKSYQKDFGKQKVYLLRTGYTQGLSAPISFDALHVKKKLLKEPKYEGVSSMLIQTTLSAATQFILDLEDREQKAFGAPLEPETIKLEYYEFRYAREMGWNGSDVFGPSSSWVDTSLFPDWLGSGAAHDRIMRLDEEEIWNWDWFDMDKKQQKKWRKTQRDQKRTTINVKEQPRPVLKKDSGGAMM